MFIRTFIQAKSRKEAEEHLKNLIELADTLNLSLVVTNFETYWKFEDSFEIEINCAEPTDEQLRKFLEGIATNWSRFPESYLASKTLDGCKILIENLEFIEIFDKDF